MCWIRSNHCLSNFIECCLVVSNIMIVKETIIDPLGDRVGWCRWPFFWNRDFLPPHHTGCGRHSTTANVGMPLAPLCLPSNPLSSSSNSRCPRVPVQVLQLLASATDQWQRWSLLSSESAPNSATRAMPRTLNCTACASQLLNRGIVVSGD